MKSIMVTNAKGGCGKSTLATNLASRLVNNGFRVGIMDLDPQQSSGSWLQARPAMAPPIVTVTESSLPAHSAVLDYLIVDTPSGTRGSNLERLLKRMDFCLVPVMPSPHDIRPAGIYIRDLSLMSSVKDGSCSIAVAANRIRPNTLVYQSLEYFLSRLGIPFVGVFRESQNYVRTAAHGLGLADLNSARMTTDSDSWDQLLDWVGANQSASLRDVG